MNLDKLTINELIDLKYEINRKINSYSDGYLYICSIRQFGSVSETKVRSIYSLRELCDEFNGENGIVDVYTNNPNLKYPEMEFYNYGDIMLIESEYDYREWVKYTKEKNFIEKVTNEIERWENGEKHLPFANRPLKPIFTEEEVKEYVSEFESKEWNFKQPINLKKND
jgi:hypothetical protein